MSTFKIVSPIDNSIVCERHYATTNEITTTLANAHNAQRTWQHSSIEERTALCEQVINYFEQNKQVIAAEICSQMGRPVEQAKGEIDGLAERARYMIGIAEEALQTHYLPAKKGFERFISREPYGIVLVLAPWNYPYLTAINTIIPAIMAGNTVILKHSSQTALCAERFAAAFVAADCAAGIFSFLHLDHSQCTALIQNPAIDFVTFTGSVAGGIQVQQAASERFIPIALELGGKDPGYVRADADLDYTIAQLVDGAFYNSGQSCCGIERIYVQAQHFDYFVEKTVSLVQQYKLGNPMDSTTTLGPMVSPKAAAHVQQQIQQAQAAGARALIDPHHFSIPDYPTYVAPQVLVDVDHSMALMQAETFGPIVGIMPVQDDMEAIQLMNDSCFGLTASIWTQDKDQAIALGRELETGTVLMNRCDYLDPALVWTGCKDSGRGYSLSALGYQQLTRAKSYHLKLDT